MQIDYSGCSAAQPAGAAPCLPTSTCYTHQPSPPVAILSGTQMDRAAVALDRRPALRAALALYLLLLHFAPLLI